MVSDSFSTIRSWIGPDLAPIVIGLPITVVLGLFTGRVVQMVKIKPMAPEGISQKRLNESLLIGREDERSASVLGFLERIIFFAAFFSNAGLVAAGWLAFKVASKWQVWEHIIQLPKEFPCEDPLERLRVRTEWGSLLLSRFLMGTLYNVFCGLAGAAVARIGP